MNGLGTYRDDEDAEERDDVAERELHEQEAADREAEKGPAPTEGEAAYERRVRLSNLADELLDGCPTAFVAPKMRRLLDEIEAERRAPAPEDFAHLSGPGLMARYLSGTVDDDA